MEGNFGNSFHTFPPVILMLRHERVKLLSGGPQDRWEPFSACPVPAEAHWVAQHGLACFTHTLPVWGMYTLSFQNQTY